MRANTPTRISGGYAHVQSVQRYGTEGMMFTPYSLQTDSGIQTRFQSQSIPKRLTLSSLGVMPSSLLGMMDIRPASTPLKHSGASAPVPSVLDPNRGAKLKTADNTPSDALPPFQPEKHEISVHELKQKLDQGEPIQLIDVREPMEHQIVCLDEAQLIPMNDLPQHIEQLDSSREIILHCHHGMRSMQAAYYLYQNGFQKVKSLSGGIDQWAIEIDPTLNRY